LESFRMLPKEAQELRQKAGGKSFTIHRPIGRVVVLLEKRAFYVKPVEFERAEALSLLGAQTNSTTLPLNAGQARRCSRLASTGGQLPGKVQGQLPRGRANLVVLCGRCL